MNEPPFDLDATLKRCMGKPQLTGLVLEKFAEQAVADLDHISKGLDAGDFLGASRSGHALKGAAGMLSAQKLFDLATAMQRVEFERNLAAAQELLMQLRAEVRECLDYLPEANRRLSQQGSAYPEKASHLS